MDLNAISSGEDFRREHGITRTRSNDRPLFHDHHMIGNAGGQSEVMQYDDNACSIQRTLHYPIKHVVLMSRIEAGQLPVLDQTSRTTTLSRGKEHTDLAHTRT